MAWRSGVVRSYWALYTALRDADLFSHTIDRGVSAAMFGIAPFP
jgi:hypothetical protein